MPTLPGPPPSLTKAKQVEPQITENDELFSTASVNNADFAMSVALPLILP
jgi:hypothetical protein